MKRRKFVRDSTLCAFGLATIGNITWDGRQFIGNNPTTTDILGPFYRPGSPFRSDLVPPGSTGQILMVSGTIHDAVSNKPLAGALIESWQCDEYMNYDNVSDAYLYRGTQKTGKDGKYQFRTIVPIAYKDGDDWRPAHIHFRVSSASHQDLITQVYFKNDPHLAGDDAARHPQSASRILEISRKQDGPAVVRFDIGMSRNLNASDEVYKKLSGIYDTGKGMVEFYRQDDLLMLKVNGQIMEGLIYKGNNTFSGGLGFNSAVFEIEQNKGVSVTLTMWDAPGNSKYKKEYKGKKVLSYA